MFPTSRLFFPLTAGMIIGLLLLINVSFKIIEIQGVIFSTNAILCAAIAGLYVLMLTYCSTSEHKQMLNICLMALYTFSLGVYFLTSLPYSGTLHNNPAYHIVFEDIPKKFFATTLAFFLSFYFPHFLYRYLNTKSAFSFLQIIIFGIAGGLLFFLINYYLLFMNLSVNDFPAEMFINSLGLCLLLLLVVLLLYSFIRLSLPATKPDNAQENSAIYTWMMCIAIVIMLISLVCEYRLVLFGDWTVAASSLLFPAVVMISSLIGELFGYKANLRFTLALVVTELVFDGLLMGLVALPSPEFFNINEYYNFIMPRRLPAASIALVATFMLNSFLLEYLRKPPLNMQLSIRIVIAGISASSLLCIVNYGLLFAGIYPYDQILHLALNAWVCKMGTMLLTLPGILKLYEVLQGYSSRLNAL